MGLDGLDGIIHGAIGGFLLEKSPDFIDFFPLFLHVVNGSAQRGTQVVKLVLHGGLLLSQCFQALLGLDHVPHLTAGFDGGFPVDDQLLLCHKCGFTGTLLEPDQVLLFLGEISLVLLLFIEPIGHLFSAITLLLYGGLLLVELPDFIVD